MVERSFDTNNYDWMKCGVDTEEFGKTSYNLSNHLLETYNDHGSRRFGAYVFDDDVPFDITVDWPLIKPYVPFVLQAASTAGLSTTVEEFLDQVVLSDFRDEVVVVNRSSFVHSFIRSFVASFVCAVRPSFSIRSFVWLFVC